MKQLEFTEEEIIESLKGVGIEVSDVYTEKPFFPTNREWLASLTDRQLAEFFTLGLQVRSLHYHTAPFTVSITRIAMGYTSSIAGIEKWLSMPQDYIVVEEKNNE